MDTVESRSVRLPHFDGTVKTFQMFWLRLMAFAHVHRFALTLKIGGEIDLPATDATAIDMSTDAGKRQAAAKRRNDVGMAHLTLAFSNEICLGIIYKAMTADWPQGLAHMVVSGLMAKYQPQDIMTGVELKQQLAAITMKVGSDPATLFEQICTIENRYNTPTRKIDQDELIATLLDRAAPEYRSLLTAVQMMKGASVKLSDFEDAMNKYWRQESANGKSEEDNDDDDNEIALAGFEGICFKCRKKGHKSNECKEDGNGGHFRGTCYNCGKPGHMSRDCWLKEENKDNRPSYWKTRETGASAIDRSSHVEFLL
jgi:hypothetical protein